MLKLGMAPAFDLSVVEEHNADHHTNAITNAAACDEMSDILSCLSLGSWRDALNHDTLKKHGVTHVLNVAKEVPCRAELEAMEGGDFSHKRIPLQDCHSEDIGEHFEEAFEFIEEAKAANGKVLVHCRRGISRSPAIVVGYLMRHNGYTYEDALEFVKSKRSCVSLNLAFRTLLEEYSPTPMIAVQPCAPALLHRTSTNDMTGGGGFEETHINQRMDSFPGDEFGLSAPESEISSQPATKDTTWD